MHDVVSQKIDPQIQLHNMCSSTNNCSEQVKESAMGEKCNMLSGDEKCIQNVSQKTWREKYILGDVGADESIILTRILKNYGVWVWSEFNWLTIWTSKEAYA
jgi:hypothetical protein